MILVNGDSWTQRESASSEPLILWPDFLKEESALEVLNIARPGSSNQRIYRSTLEALYTTTKPISHLIIGWSAITRSELPTSTGGHFLITPSGIRGQPSVSKSVQDQLFNLFYKHCFNNELAIKDFLIMILSLQELCKHRKIKLLNFQSFNNNFYQLDDKFLDLYNQLDLDSWIFINNPMQQVLKDFPFEPSNHVGTLGNKRWAEIIKERL